MAIDTIKIFTEVGAEFATEIQKKCIKRMAIEMETGNIEYEITTGTLSGTYDSRISIRVVPSPSWSLIVECSIHKVLIGHNVYGGTDNLLACVNYLHNKLEELLNVKFPFCFYKWQLMRIDLAEVYDLKSSEAVIQWIRSINSCSFPRRNVDRYGANGLGAYGQVTSIKCYHKGPDFWLHDRKRLMKSGVDVYRLQEIANNLLRVEVEIKAKKLKTMYNNYPYIKCVNMAMLYSIYDREVYKLLKEGKSEMTQVKNTYDVKQRLFNMYSDTLASSLLATWYQLTTLGEEMVKSAMKKSKYYNHMKYLKESGISWHGTDIVMLDNAIVPNDFSPVRNDCRRLFGESKEMISVLDSYKIAV